MALLARFADLLEYPADDLPRRVQACADGLPGAAAAPLRRFQAEAARIGLARLEEEYAAAFDMDAACALYAGHQLFGETPRRTLLLCRLSAEYREHGFAVPSGELADYLPLILRYADRGEDDHDEADDDDAATVRRELLADIALPAARKLEQALAARAHSYAPVLRTLVVALSAADVASCAEAVVPAGEPTV